LKHLSHPNIIKLRDLVLEGEGQKELYLVLDYLPFDIKRILKSNLVLTLKNVKEIVFQTLAGLNYCHQCQVLHRDLKPENILVTEDLLEVKLCDFGLVRLLEEPDEN
jgi:serine/threonine protein kinase